MLVPDVDLPWSMGCVLEGLIDVAPRRVTKYLGGSL